MTAKTNATTAQRDATRRPDIQGLRALAIIMVVAFHAGLDVPGGFAGVDVFFAISGFVITGVLTRELEARGRIDLPRFYARRVKRLFPALAAMIIIVVVTGVVLNPTGTGRTTALTGIFASLVSANFYLYSLPTGYFTNSVQLDPLLHTWTLAVEEQFYLVYPAVLLAAWSLGSRIRRPRATATLLIAAGSGLSFTLAAGWAAGSSTFASVNSPVAFAFYASPARAWEFGAGCVVALVAPAFRRMPALVGFAFAAIGLAAITFTALSTSSTDSLSIIAGIPVGGCCALLLAGFAVENPLSRLLAARPIVAIGDRSYSLYLWHWPLIVFTRALFPGSGWVGPTAAAATIVPTWASYRFLEKPIRRSPRVRGRLVAALAFGCIALPIGASAGLARVQSILPITSATAFHADYARGCDSIAPLGAPSRAACTWRVAHPRGTIVLIGDSNAGHFTEPVTIAALKAGYDATVATLSDCPFVQVRVEFNGNVGCTGHNRRSFLALIRMRPSLVIIAARTDAYINGAIARIGPLAGRRLEREPARKAQLYSDGLKTELVALSEQGVPVIVVHPVPLLRSNQQGCAVILLILSSCRGAVPREVVDAELQTSIAAERRALSGLPTTSTLDFENRLCTVTTCASRRAHGGLILYRNENHLSVKGALTLTNDFYNAIRTHAVRAACRPTTGRR